MAGLASRNPDRFREQVVNSIRQGQSLPLLVKLEVPGIDVARAKLKALEGHLGSLPSAGPGSFDFDP